MKPKTPNAPALKPAERDSQGRVRVEYRGRVMRYGTAMKLASLEALIQRANSKRMTIPKAAEWLGYSESALRNWIGVLGVKWKRGRDRRVYKYDRTGWDEAIVAGLKEGKTLTSISKQLGVGHWMVVRHAKQHGLWAVVLNQVSADR
jgi:hypothetical protein